jgi:hypothetical protein
MHERILRAFARWFASGAGVWQTFLVTVAVVIAEFACPDMDPSGFWLLFWFTIYSGITQPALAYVSQQADLESNSILLNIKHLDEEELAALKRLAAKSEED